MPSPYDLIVTGGGPAGSTLATLVAMQGHKVLLLERDRFPRYQIGESLLPATINGICRMLGVEEQVKQAGFVKKLGGTFRWGGEDGFWTLNFGKSAELGDPDDEHRVHAYEVRRDEFDTILLRNAEKHGVDVREGHRVQDVVMSDDRVTGVRFIDETGSEQTAVARFTADASGHQSRIVRRVGERIYSNFYRNIAVYAYYEHGKRLPGDDAGNVLFEAFDDGWLWYIPLSDTLTSIGAVVPDRHADKLKGDHSEVLQSFIDACPIVTDYLSDAVRASSPPYDEVRIRKEFSYGHSQFYAPGLYLVGDTACFIDVLLSSGVHLATYAALFAARSINSCLKGDLDETTAGNEYELRYRLEFSKLYQLLIGLYDMTKDRPTYHAWLRSWLQTTNAFALEPEEQTPVQAKKRSDLSKRVSLMRRLNAAMLKSVQGPRHMESVGMLPPIKGGLAIAADRMHWV